MKKILLIILAAGCTMALVSCEEWLDKYPLAQMSPETFFSNENELQAFSNKFYTVFPSDGLYNEYWDNIIHNDLPQEMRGGRTIPASGGGWTWTDLRDINTLLEYSVNCKDLDVRNHYDALARFFRAYFYFEKIKRFGDVPWYAKPIGSADPELKRPRDSREYVMQRMIEDIDFAILYLPTTRPLPYHEMDGSGPEIAFLSLRRHVPQIPRHRPSGERLEILPQPVGEGFRRVHHQQRLRTLHHGRHADRLPRPVRVGRRAAA